MNSRSKSSNRIIALTFVLILLALLLALPISLKAQIVGPGGSLFTDIKAHRIGDLLTVLIYENAEASNESALKTEETADASTKSSGGIGPLNFIPLFGADYQADNNYDGKGKNSRKGSIRARMTVEVVAVRNNGDLAISGSRVISINTEDETMTLSGVVRPADVAPDNTVESSAIGNAKIEYTGKGPAANGSKPGLVTRVLNWIF
jgi:flagellar L-ring protein precursor FlgH